MLTTMGGNNSPLVFSLLLLLLPSGQTGTDAHVPSGVRISNPGCPGRWKRRVMVP